MTSFETMFSYIPVANSMFKLSGCASKKGGMNALPDSIAEKEIKQLDLGVGPPAFSFT